MKLRHLINELINNSAFVFNESQDQLTLNQMYECEITWSYPVHAAAPITQIDIDPETIELWPMKIKIADYVKSVTVRNTAPGFEDLVLDLDEDADHIILTL
jgi:hypothetical protein